MNKDRNLRNLKNFNNLSSYNYENICSFNTRCNFKGKNKVINSCQACENIDVYRYYVDKLSCKQLSDFRKSFKPSIL